MDVDVSSSPHPHPATAGTATATGSPHDQQVATSIGRRRLGLLLGPAVLAAVLVSPLPLTRSQHDLVAVLAFTMTYWVTEALPIPATSLLALALCVLLDVPRATGQDASPGAVVFAGFSSPTMFLFIGGFILAQAMIKHGLNRRLALAVLALPRVARSSYRVVVAFGLLGAALSSMIANGAVATMLLPIAIGIDRSLAGLMRHKVPGLAQRTRLRFSTGLMLMTAYGITVGGLMTPIGDPSNLIGRSFIAGELKTRISFVRWVELAAPVVIVLFVVLSVVLLVLNRPEVGRFEGARRLIQRQRGQLGPMSRGERNVLLAFLAALALWVLPTVVGLIAGSDSAVHRMLEARVDEAVAAIMAATLLFVVPVDWRHRKFTLSWEDAARIDWGTILLIGTGLTLGRLMYSTGLATVVGETLAGSLGAGAGAWTVDLLAAATAILISETTSNTASVGIIVPIIPALAASAGIDPVTPALIAVFAATYGFMLPISTSANAIAYSSGAIPIRAMIRCGFLVDLSGILIIVVGTRLMVRLVGAT